jgi:hypothetical protein
LFLGRITLLPKPELAYFAIADISGYTSFLAGVELDDAQDIIAARCELRSASRLP